MVMLTCCYCGKECINSNSHKNHERRCPKNQNRVYVNGMTGKKGKRHSEEALEKMRISQKNVNRSGDKNPFFGKTHSEETRKHLSEIRKRFLDVNPEKVPYKLNHSSKISYPEMYFIECFLKYSNCSFQHQIGRYTVDFANVEEKLYLEIDGEQHYVDKRIVKHDLERTQLLDSLGWRGVRIRWKDFRKCEDKEAFVTNIGSVMKWLS